MHYLKKKTVCEVCGEVHDRYFPRCPTLPFEEYTPGEEWPSEDATLAIESSANNAQGQARETLIRFKGKVAGREARILIDSGASRNFMDTDFTKKAKLHISIHFNQLTVDMANSEPCLL